MKNAFALYEQEVEKSILNAKKKIVRERLNRRYIAHSDYIFQKIRKEIIESLQNDQAYADLEENDMILDIPPEHIKADLTVGIFQYAKKCCKEARTIALNIGRVINAKKGVYIEKALVAGAYINVSVYKQKIYSEVLQQVQGFDESYGETDINSSKVAVMDYSSPNIAKPFGVGHLRSTIIGQALMNIYNACGYTTIGDNHLGDWGTQFGALIYAYETWGNKQEVEAHPIQALNTLYVKFHEQAEKDESLKEKAREIFSKLEKGDEKYVAYWKLFRDWSLADFHSVYNLLGVRFDTEIGESYYLKDSDKIVEDCQAKKLCEKDPKTGAIVIPEKKNIPSFLLRKQDGSTLYITRDLATVLMRIREFHPHAIVYIVGREQELNFKQLFSLSLDLGYISDKIDIKHVSFGLILIQGKKMATRKGTNIELEDLINKSIARSRSIMEKKNKTLTKQELSAISKVIGIGAIIYNDLKQSRINNISFDWDRMLDFTGGSAVYLQYTYVRIQSILKKLQFQENERYNGIFETEIEFSLAKKIMVFPEIIIKAQKNNAPHLIAVYLEELAQKFNAFYNEVSIMNTEDKKLQTSRLALIASIASVIKQGLRLLNIEVPEKM